MLVLTLHHSGMSQIVVVSRLKMNIFPHLGTTYHQTHKARVVHSSTDPSSHSLCREAFRSCLLGIHRTRHLNTDKGTRGFGLTLPLAELNLFCKPQRFEPHNFGSPSVGDRCAACGGDYMRLQGIPAIEDGVSNALFKMTIPMSSNQE